MIHGLDCIRLAAASPDGALQDYATLLGRTPAGAALSVANARLEVVEKPSFGAEGLAEMSFAVTDLAKARNLLERRALRVHLEGAGPGRGVRLDRVRIGETTSNSIEFFGGRESGEPTRKVRT